MEMTDAERGWIEVRDLLTAAESAAIVDACTAICADANNRHPRDKPVAGTIHLEELDRRVTEVADVVEQTTLRDAVASWFGSHDIPAPMQVSLRSPGPGFGSQDLHRDTMEGPPPDVPEVVTAIVALTDFTERNGSTRIIPGSHRTSQPAATFRDRQRSAQEVALTGPAGTAFVFSGHALHGGGQNNSTRHRHALQIVWRRGPV